MPYSHDRDSRSNRLLIDSSGLSRQSCPLVEMHHSACAEHLRLEDLDKAFGFCFGGKHHLCQFYQRLRSQSRDPIELGTAGAGVSGRHDVENGNFSAKQR